MNIKFWLPILFLALPVHADWVEDSVIVDVDSTDPKLITTSLTQFQDMLNYLNAENLTSPGRVKIKKFTGRIARYHWENDMNCAVKDPSAIMPVNMSSSHAEYVYEGSSNTLWAVDNLIVEADPCLGPMPKPTAKFKAYKK